MEVKDVTSTWMDCIYIIHLFMIMLKRIFQTTSVIIINMQIYFAISCHRHPGLIQCKFIHLSEYSSGTHIIYWQSNAIDCCCSRYVVLICNRNRRSATCVSFPLHNGLSRLCDKYGTHMSHKYFTIVT